MARLIPAAERIIRARAFIQQARDFPIEADLGPHDISYIANVKDLLQQARDMVKFINFSPSASAEIKNDARKIFEEADLANDEILHKKKKENL